MPVGLARDLDKDLNKSQPLLLRVRFKSLNKFMFFYISTLRSKFRARLIDLKRDLYVAGAGQKLAVAVSRTKEHTALQTEIDKLKDKFIGNPPSRKRKPTYSRRPPVVTVEEDSEEDLEDSDNDSDKDGSEEEDDGDEDLEG